MIKKIVILLISCSIIACGSNIDLTNNDEEDNTDSSLFKGTEQSLDIISWNIENFPKSSDTEEYLIQIFNDLQPDIIAIQETADTEKLYQIAANLTDYVAITNESYDAEQENYYNPPVSYLVSTDITVNNFFYMQNTNSTGFPRDPLVLEFYWNDSFYTAINIHLKAMGDNVIDYGDYSDPELRRLIASCDLETFVNNYYPDEKVFIIGDFNDRIEEPEETNVFWNFIENEENFIFADMEIAEESESFSYPSSSSHIDHIIITNELYNAFLNEDSNISVLDIEKHYFNNHFNLYENIISDHKPVGIQLFFEEE